MFPRTIEKEVVELVSDTPAIALLGPRQVGKTTLVRQLATHFPHPSIYLDLESDTDLNRLRDAELYLGEREESTIIIDEIQRMPSLFPLLRSLIDKKRVPGRFVLLGSASPDLLKNSSETLAGRISYLELHPLMFEEVKEQVSYREHWLRGGFPDVLQAVSDNSAFRKMGDFISTYLERDLPLLGIPANPRGMRLLMNMLVSVHGSLLNVSQLGNSLKLSVPTVQNYLGYLENAFLIRRLQPWFVNISKRLVKTPKLYIRDSGMLHSLAGITDPEELAGNILLGNSWEGYVIQQVIAGLPYNIQPYFYRTQDGAELDLVLVKGNNVKVAVEIKYTNSPVLSRGNTLAQDDLGSPPLLVVTPSAEDYNMRENVMVCSIGTLTEHLKRLLK
ncbi:putative AAA+ superfamily ATPase [Dyadobacter sp. BE34]|uniref:AAA+ superfamily ATPase n=1 Tax=Dyadobacter fermentans TaxID=94254 RepID=A0ABU1R3D3_9BACT|nr:MULTISPECIES: ATP-binding protein [Dyadobacter]MDR6807919.1 putative AAA+ superfamily ATPase [Dyadobacter fermentans]MDR7045660.1 putative AAA+ superfamily ATPase [Dyadobacter sp. BE242]MDR7199973.1 putative AAA+ superfamily ATPase [Dyadobacter sp. BE34]MDR7217568.1 putative AAA+ superfamily ATPase [Dyadobacter sp. BE31]MDR7265864.1 putative AAA+ superfamily ATPase [Dyadobacter sp. BE32]